MTNDEMTNGQMAFRWRFVRPWVTTYPGASGQAL